MLTLALADHPFLDHLTKKLGGPSCGRLPEGQSLRVIYYDSIQQQSSKDQAEVNQVQCLLLEMTPLPLMDENQCNYDGDADVASDIFPPPTPLAHMSLSDEEITEQPSALAGATMQGEIAAEGEIIKVAQ
jgi:hypothetical protein